MSITDSYSLETIPQKYCFYLLIKKVIRTLDGHVKYIFQFYILYISLYYIIQCDEQRACYIPDNLHAFKLLDLLAIPRHIIAIIFKQDRNGIQAC